MGSAGLPCGCRQFAKPSTELQALQLKLADMLTRSTASRQMVLLASDRLDRGHPQATLLLLCDGQALCHRPVPRNPDEVLQRHGGSG
ncbi:acyl-CoA dehydrogenase family protein [Azotobacter salinestris]|uniref:acyl-CoA dehydrogenase family protein n=1 Tax=Azotobacter salinestris TaxID=69964 RepID=UPI001266DE4F